MSIVVKLPTPLQRYADGQEELVVEAPTVGSALKAVAEAWPKLATHLFDAKGAVRSYVNVYLGDEDTRYLNGAETPLKEGDSLTIVPSIAGG